MKPTIYRPTLRGRTPPPTEDPAERNTHTFGGPKTPESTPSAPGKRRSSGAMKSQS